MDKGKYTDFYGIITKNKKINNRIIKLLNIKLWLKLLIFKIYLFKLLTKLSYIESFSLRAFGNKNFSSSEPSILKVILDLKKEFIIVDFLI